MENGNCKKIELFPDEKVLYGTGRGLLPRFALLCVGFMSVGLVFTILYVTISDFRSAPVATLLLLILELCFIFAACHALCFCMKTLCRNLKDKVLITNKRVHWLIGGERGFIERKKVRFYCFYETYSPRAGKTYLIVVPKKGAEIPILLTWTRYSVKRIAEVLKINATTFRKQRVIVTVVILSVFFLILLYYVFY